MLTGPPAGGGGRAPRGGRGWPSEECAEAHSLLGSWLSHTPLGLLQVELAPCRFVIRLIRRVGGISGATSCMRNLKVPAVLPCSFLERAMQYDEMPSGTLLQEGVGRWKTGEGSVSGAHWAVERRLPSPVSSPAAQTDTQNGGAPASWGVTQAKESGEKSFRK